VQRSRVRSGGGTLRTTPKPQNSARCRICGNLSSLTVSKRTKERSPIETETGGRNSTNSKLPPETVSVKKAAGQVRRGDVGAKSDGSTFVGKQCGKKKEQICFVSHVFPGEVLLTRFKRRRIPHCLTKRRRAGRRETANLLLNISFHPTDFLDRANIGTRRSIN